MSNTLKSKILGRFDKDELISILNNHPEQFEFAVKYALSNEKSISWRAAWLVFHSIKKNDDRLKSHILNFISALKGKGDGHQREILKIICKVFLLKKRIILLILKIFSFYLLNKRKCLSVRLI